MKVIDYMRKPKKWRLRIRVQKEQRYIGTYDTYEEAEKAYEEAFWRFFHQGIIEQEEH